jgi:hypothetical protein
MKSILFKLFYAFLLVSLVACSLPGGTLDPITSEPVGEATETAFEDDSAPLPPADFVSILEDKVASGEWTREEGLVTLLQVFAGEVTVDQSGIDTSSLLESEGTGILSLAAEYMISGTDETAKAEIARLVKLLVPTQEALLQYSQEGTGQSVSGQKMAAPSNQAPDCAGLWRAGFPDNRTPAFPCFLANTQNIGGSTYQVFFPSAWNGDAAKIHYYDLTRQAIADSVPVMQSYGEVNSIYFVFHTLADNTYPTSVLAETYFAYHQPGSEACPIIIYPKMMELPDAAFLQAAAHEIAHCFEVFNLREQMVDAGYDSAKWWVEGWAEYMSNVVYPAADFEYRFLNAFNHNSLRSTLIEMSYENFIFFQFLANRIGTDGTLDLLETLPITAGTDEQLSALANYSEMPNLFESFAQQFIDNRITDASGSIKPYATQYLDGGSTTAAGTINLTYKAFTLRRHKISVQEGNKYTYTLPASPEDLRIQFRIALAPVTWTQIPVTIDAGCRELTYVLYGIGVGTYAEIEQTQIQISAEPSVCTPGCLVGSWELDNEVYKTYLKSFFISSGAGDPTIDWIDGHSLVSFDEHGNTAIEYQHLTTRMTLHTSEDLFDKPMTPEMTVYMNGGGTANYTATETTIISSNPVTNFEISIEYYVNNTLIPGVPFTIDQTSFGGGPLAGTTEYLCLGDTLLIQVPAEGNPVLAYYRIQP